MQKPIAARESKISRTLSSRFMKKVILIIMGMLFFNPVFVEETYITSDNESAFSRSLKTAETIYQ